MIQKLKTIALLCITIIVYSEQLQAQRMIKNIDPKKSYEHIKYVIANEDLVFFTANDSIHGEELWRTSGTEASSVLLKDINPGTNSAWNDFQGREFILFANKIYFNANDGVNGDELWVSDGTSTNTLMLKDINTGSSSSSPKNFFVFNNYLYFTALTAVGTELWRTDGTLAGTALVKNINQKTAFASSNPRFFTIFNNQLFFKAEDGISGSQIWKTDGTDAGTVKVSNGNPGNANGLSIQNLIASNNLMYFTGNNGSGDLELYKSDGTETGTVLLKNINPTGSSYPSIFTIYKNKAYFKANDGTNGEELWSSDGTDAGTVIVKDFYTGNVSGMSVHYGYANYKGELYFSARGTGENAEIWKTNGTTNGTVKVSNLNANGNSNPSGYFVHGNTLYFSAIYGPDGSNAYELFKTDGTIAGTELTSNINKQANGDAGIQFLTPYQDKLIFTARNQEYGQELWAIDNVLTQSTYEASVCDSLLINNNTYKNSGTYLQYLKNKVGYDSLITITLFVYGKPTITQEWDSLSTWSNASSYQWQLNGQDIVGATNKKYKPLVNGVYSVNIVFLIKKGITCNKKSEVFNLQNVGLFSNVNQSEIAIYPNPAHSILNIKSNDKIENVQIIGLDGKIVLESKSTQLNINALNAGCYFVKIKTSKGYFNSKLVIEH